MDQKLIKIVVLFSGDKFLVKKKKEKEKEKEKEKDVLDKSDSEDENEEFYEAFTFDDEGKPIPEEFNSDDWPSTQEFDEADEEGDSKELQAVIREKREDFGFLNGAEFQKQYTIAAKVKKSQDLERLYGYFNAINKKVFGDKFDKEKFVIRFGELSRVAGYFKGSVQEKDDRCLIVLSRNADEKSFAHTFDTLCHEMCHAFFHLNGQRDEYHGPNFKAKLMECKHVFSFISSDRFYSESFKKGLKYRCPNPVCGIRYTLPYRDTVLEKRCKTCFTELIEDFKDKAKFNKSEEIPEDDLVIKYGDVLTYRLGTERGTCTITKTYPYNSSIFEIQDRDTKEVFFINGKSDFYAEVGGKVYTTYDITTKYDNAEDDTEWRPFNYNNYDEAEITNLDFLKIRMEEEEGKEKEKEKEKDKDKDKDKDEDEEKPKVESIEIEDSQPSQEEEEEARGETKKRRVVVSSKRYHMFNVIKKFNISVSYFRRDWKDEWLTDDFINLCLEDMKNIRNKFAIPSLEDVKIKEALCQVEFEGSLAFLDLMNENKTQLLPSIKILDTSMYQSFYYFAANVRKEEKGAEEEEKRSQYVLERGNHWILIKITFFHTKPGFAVTFFDPDVAACKYLYEKLKLQIRRKMCGFDYLSMHDRKQEFSCYKQIKNVYNVSSSQCGVFLLVYAALEACAPMGFGYRNKREPIAIDMLNKYFNYKLPGEAQMIPYTGISQVFPTEGDAGKDITTLNIFKARCALYKRFMSSIFKDDATLKWEGVLFHAPIERRVELYPNLYAGIATKTEESLIVQPGDFIYDPQAEDAYPITKVYSLEERYRTGVFFEASDMKTPAFEDFKFSLIDIDKALKNIKKPTRGSKGWLYTQPNACVTRLMALNKSGEIDIRDYILSDPKDAIMYFYEKGSG